MNKEPEFYVYKDRNKDSLTWRLYSNTSLSNKSEYYDGFGEETNDQGYDKVLFNSVARYNTNNGINSSRQSPTLLMKDFITNPLSLNISNSWSGLDESSSFGALNSILTAGKAKESIVNFADKAKQVGKSTLDAAGAIGQVLSNTNLPVVKQLGQLANFITGKIYDWTSIENILKESRSMSDALEKLAADSNIGKRDLMTSSYNLNLTTTMLKRYSGSAISIPINLSFRVYNYGVATKEDRNIQVAGYDIRNDSFTDILRRLTNYLGPTPLNGAGAQKKDDNTEFMNAKNLLANISMGDGEVVSYNTIKDFATVDIAPHSYYNTIFNPKVIADGCKKDTPISGLLTLFIGRDIVINNLLSDGLSIDFSNERSRDNKPLYADVRVNLQPAFKYTSDWVDLTLRRMGSTKFTEETDKDNNPTGGV